MRHETKDRTIIELDNRVNLGKVLHTQLEQTSNRRPMGPTLHQNQSSSSLPSYIVLELKSTPRPTRQVEEYVVSYISYKYLFTTTDDMYLYVIPVMERGAWRVESLIHVI